MVAVAQIAGMALGLAGTLLVVRQCRHPRSLPGRLFIALMNRTHSSVTSWGLSYVAPPHGAVILDVGCGGGLTVRRLADLGNTVHGIDYSETSVAAATKRNADLIAAGRVTVRRASVSALPFVDRYFDLVTAVETHYYWPEPVKDLQEIRRVLKPGGTVLLIAETYRDQRFSAFLVVPMLLLRARYLTLEEHRALLNDAGFTDIQIQHDSKQGWICAIAHRPAT